MSHIASATGAAQMTELIDDIPENIIVPPVTTAPGASQTTEIV